MKNVKLAKLKDSIVYQMSLGSRELFHSNLWAWMMEKEPRVISEVFFKGIAIPGTYSVEREDGNRDITIYIGNDVYVIENKFKAIPTEDQLIKYSKEISITKAILTGLRVPSFNLPNKNNEYLSNWEFLSYSTIIENLGELLKTPKELAFTPKEIDVLEKYIEMLQGIINIVKIEVPEEGLLLKISAKDFEDYHKIRLDDLLIKQHTDKFCKYLLKRQEITSRMNKETNGYHLCVEPDFRNSTGIVNVFYRKGTKKEKNEYLIGVQIQSNQFRYCVAAPKEDYRSIFEAYKAYGWFEEYSKTGKKEFKGNGSSMSPRDGGSYNKYNGTSKFVYQYFDLTDLTYENIVGLLDKALDEAKTIIQQIKSK